MKKTAKKTKSKSTAVKKSVLPLKTPIDQTFDDLLTRSRLYGSPIVDISNVYQDARGDIINIVNKPVGSVVLITSRANTVRANHWHKTDSHLCFVLKGSVHYFERPVGSKEKPSYKLISAGQAFITGPNVEHAMKFTEETTFLTLGKLSRTPSEYEADLIRLKVPLAIPDAPKAASTATPEPVTKPDAPAALNTNGTPTAAA